MDARLYNSPAGGGEQNSPILVIPYMWIGDFVRCHSVVSLLKARWPSRPIDVVTSAVTAPLVDYMPGVRKGVVAGLPRGRLGLGTQIDLARRLRQEDYGTALVMSRKWKAALAPFLAGIPERIGYVGEARFLLLNAPRWGEGRLPRMVDQCAALALPEGAAPAPFLPPPELVVPQTEVAAWRRQNHLVESKPVVALAPGSIGPSKRWPAECYGALASELARQGYAIWVIGGPGEHDLAAEIRNASGGVARDLTGHDLRDAVMALSVARIAVSNDSGLLHVSAAIGTPTIGVFGPTSAWHWAPLNPLAAVIAAEAPPPCQPCHRPTCRFGHQQCMRDIPPAQLLAAVREALDPARIIATGTP